MPPVVDEEEDDAGNITRTYFVPSEWREENPSAGPGDEPYHFANRARVGNELGWLWPWCPLWFVSEYAPQALALEAHFAVRLRKASEKGRSPLLLGGSTLSNRGYALLELAERAHDTILKAENKRLDEERKHKDAVNRARAGRR